GQPNAAPFSFFNVFGEDPATVGFAINHRSSVDRKDTGENIRHQQEFVVNLVSEDTLRQMNISAIEFGPETNELAEAGLTPAPSTTVRTPRIAESRVALECRLMQIVKLGPMRSLILGEVLAMHIRDNAVLDRENCLIDTPRLEIIGRMQAHTDIRTADTLRMPTIPLEEWEARRKTSQDG
ncbi:MAG: flavin reductase family protein, partial [Burkholderiales bacterium]